MTDNKNLKHGIHITHNDADAVGCALLAVNIFPEYDLVDNTHFCAIGHQDETLRNHINAAISAGNIPELVIISDLSISEDTRLFLEEKATTHGITLFGVDHHITNPIEDDCEWFKVIRDKHYEELEGEEVPISAARYMQILASERLPYLGFLFNDLIKMISRYDTWTWRSHPIDWSKRYPGMADDLIATVCSKIGPETCFKELLDFYSFDRDRRSVNATPLHMVPDYFYTLYKNIEKERTRYINNIPIKTKVVDMSFDGCNYKVAVFPAENEYANAAAEYIYNNYTFVDFVAVLYPTTSSVSLRTSKPNINVAEIATNFGGGGHATASGCEISKPEMVSAMATYLLAGDVLADYPAWYEEFEIALAELEERESEWIEEKKGESTNI